MELMNISDFVDMIIDDPECVNEDEFYADDVMVSVIDCNTRKESRFELSHVYNVLLEIEKVHKTKIIGIEQTTDILYIIRNTHKPFPILFFSTNDELKYEEY